METSPSPLPTFTTHSSENHADTAARVITELNLHHNNDPYPCDDDFYTSFPPNPNDAVQEQNDEDDDESEFEFVVLCGGDNSSPFSADEIFHNGLIKPMFPIFDTDLVHQNDAVPLRRLLMEERENGVVGESCSSSSEADDLEGVPPGTYCVWAPKVKNSQDDDVLTMRKKSNSTGAANSKRWRIRDLLHRSNSDGKDTFVFMTPSRHHNGGGDSKRREKAPTAAKRRESYLPYRQDVVGFFANVNGISRTVRPF